MFSQSRDLAELVKLIIDKSKPQAEGLLGAGTADLMHWWLFGSEGSARSLKVCKLLCI